MVNAPTIPGQKSSSTLLLTSMSAKVGGHYFQLSDKKPPAPNQRSAFGGISGFTGGGGYESGYGEGAYESGGVDYGGGIQPGGGRNSVNVVGTQLPSVDLPDTAITPITGMLWGPQTTDAVALRLSSSADLNTAMDHLMLGSTIPSDKIRQATYSLFEKNIRPERMLW